MPTEKVYLGDSVYASFDGFHIELATNNGVVDSNVIYLEPGVVQGLFKFIEKAYGVKIEMTKEGTGHVEK